MIQARDRLVLAGSLLALTDKAPERISSKWLVVTANAAEQAPVRGRDDAIAYLRDGEDRQLLPVNGEGASLNVYARLVSRSRDLVERLLLKRTADDLPRV